MSAYKADSLLRINTLRKALRPIDSSPLYTFLDSRSSSKNNFSIESYASKNLPRCSPTSPSASFGSFFATYWTRCTSSLYCRFSSLVGLGCLAVNCFFRSSSTSLSSPAVPLISLYKAHPFFASAIAVCAAASRVSGSMLYPLKTSDNRSIMIAPALPIRIVSIFLRRAHMPLYLSAQTSS